MSFSLVFRNKNIFQTCWNNWNFFIGLLSRSDGKLSYYINIGTFWLYMGFKHKFCFHKAIIPMNLNHKKCEELFIRINFTNLMRLFYLRNISK